MSKVKCVVSEAHEKPEEQFSVRHGVSDEPVKIYRCPSCGTLIAETEFEISPYEGEEYYTRKFDALPEIENEWGFRWRLILEEIQKYKPKGVILDVGAGNGYFLNLCSKEFDYDVRGIELSPSAIKFAKEILDVDLTLSELASVDEMFDVSCAFNVLEHVPEPSRFFADLVNVTKPGGVIVITTPSPKAIHVRTQGLQKWNMLCPPHHLNIFTKRALFELCASHSLEVLHYETISTYLRVLRNFELGSTFPRQVICKLLSLLNMGADHFLIAKLKM